jgi:hypothetical protein
MARGWAIANLVFGLLSELAALLRALWFDLILFCPPALVAPTACLSFLQGGWLAGIAGLLLIVGSTLVLW